MVLSRKQAWVTAIVWAAFIEVLTSLPASAFPEIKTTWRIDWLVHFGMYGLFGLLLARVGVVSGWSRSRFVLLALLISVFGALDELHQLFIPSRDAEVMDWVMDTMGSSTGVAVLVWAAGTALKNFLVP